MRSLGIFGRNLPLVEDRKKAVLNIPLLGRIVKKGEAPSLDFKKMFQTLNDRLRSQGVKSYEIRAKAPIKTMERLLRRHGGKVVEKNGTRSVIINRTID